jgi:malonyl-CoA decarboxylase
MFKDLKDAAERQRSARATRRLVADCKRLLSEDGEMGGMALAAGLVERLAELAAEPPEALDGLFDFLASGLNPDPATVLRCAQAYAEGPGVASLAALTAAAEPPRQELFRRLNRIPGGTAAVLSLRRALMQRLRTRPELGVIEADLLHLLGSWFNPGFLQIRRVDWNSPAQLLEKVIQHDRRCFAFFHPQLPAEPLIFVEVALLPEVPAAIAPLIDKASTPLLPDRFRTAAFYSISNCEPGLKGVSLGNFLIKTVAQQLQREVPRLRTFATLSPIPGFANWLLARPDLATLPGVKKAGAAELQAAHERLLALCGGDLQALRSRALHDTMGEDDTAALQRLCAAYLLCLSATPQGDPVARFHLDNGARLERLNPRGNLSASGLRQSFGMMVNYLYDLDKVEAHHARFRQGEIVRSRAIGTPF